ncbi:MAG TPA: hypothetical protein VF420_08145 [Casimicrobiaceae bacterium]
MRAYRPSAPRFALALVAAAMSAATLGILVVVPAGLEPDGERQAMLAAIGAGAGISSLEAAASNCLDAPPASQVGPAGAPELERG